jgi:hypothetical protein
MSAATIFAGFIFGTIGFSAFLYGKKTMLFKPMLLGVVLMVYPYFISNNFALWSIGAVLTAALFLWH